MTLSLNVWDYIAIAFMLVVSASMGLYFRFSGGRQKTMDEFLMGGRSMAILPVSFSLMATYMSAIAMLGIPAEIYMYGTQISMWVFGLPIGCFFVAYGCLPAYFDLNISTPYEYLEVRFGKTTRNVAAITFIVCTVFYTAVVLYTPSLALNAVTGISTWSIILSLSAVCVFYCSLGGLKAVLWTDVFQATLMYITIVSIVIAGIINIGLEEIFRISQLGGRMIFLNFSTSMTERYTFWNALIAGIYFGFQTFGTSQSMVQRMLSVGKLRKAQWSLFWGLVLICIFMMTCYLAGLVMYSLFYDCDPMLNPEIHLRSPDQMLPYSILKLLGSFIFLPGLCIAGMFSGALSSVSSALNSMTAVFVEDFIKPYCQCKGIKESWMNILAKLLAVAFGGLSLLMIFTVSNFRGVLEAASVLNGIPVGPIVGVFILALFTTTANEPAFKIMDQKRKRLPGHQHRLRRLTSDEATKLMSNYLMGCSKDSQGALVGFAAGIVINSWISIGAYITKVKLPPLARSTAGCHLMRNETDFEEHFFLYAQNATFLLTNVTQLLNEERRNVFPLYKIAYLWYAKIGTCVSVIVGYLASYIIGLFIDTPDINPSSISPLVRNFHFPSKVSEASKGEISRKTSDKMVQVTLERQKKNKDHITQSEEIRLEELSNGKSNGTNLQE